MTSIDYTLPAELFMTKAKSMRKQPITYRRFATAADAIKFAIEEIPASLLPGVVLEVAEKRFDHVAIRELYKNADYPAEDRPE